jgi:hypothetical protein
MAENSETLDRELIHVVPEYGLWRVDGNGGGNFDTRAKAVRHAKALAKENAPCKVIVYAEDGTVEEEEEY